MAWDDEKQVAPGTEEGELTPEEWNEHVADQKGHSGRHESGGIDELTVEGLSGDLADAQDPKAEVTRDIVDAFLDGGTNVTVSRDADTLTIDTTGLNDQEVADKIGAVVEGGSQTTVTYDSGTQTATITIDAPTQAAFDDHSTRHESGGADELSVTGLSGDLADEQDAKPHDIGGATHTADTLANLNSKVSDATLDDTADPREPEAHAATHEGGSDSLNVFDLTGDLVGQGLERVNDTLQVLSSIWDGTNVVADVNNTNTTTQTLEAESVSTENLNSIEYVTPDQNRSIQDAVDDLPSSGGTVVLSEGEWVEDATVPIDGSDQHYAIVVLPDNVTLRGQGESTIIKLADGQDTDEKPQVIANEDFENGNEGIRIYDLVVDANKDGQDVENIGDGSSADQRQWEGIDFVECVDVKVVGIVAKNAVGDGVDYDDCERVQTINSRFENNGGNGIHNSGVIDSKSVGNTTINNGHLHDRGGIDFRSISMDGDEGQNLISGHTSIEDYYGIHVARGTCDVVNSVVRDSVSHGVLAGDDTVYGDINAQVWNAGDHACRIDTDGRVTINGGRYVDADGDGINITSASEDGDHSAIGTTISGCDNGVFLRVGMSLVDLQVFDCFDESILADRSVANESKELIIEGGLIKHGGDDGIRVDTWDDLVTIKGTDIIDVGPRGIHVSLSSDNSEAVIKGVTVRESSDVGIQIRNDGHTVQGCTVFDGETGFDVDGDECLIAENTARDVLTGFDIDGTDNVERGNETF